MDTSTEQETFEPTREQMARVEALAIEHESVRVTLDAAARTVTAEAMGPWGSAEGKFVFDENGDDVTIASASVPFVEVQLPVEVVTALIGAERFEELLAESASEIDILRPSRIGRQIVDVVVDSLRGQAA